MKISINVNSDLQIGLKRLAKLLKIEFGEGVKVNAICGDRIGAAFKTARDLSIIRKSIISLESLAFLWRMQKRARILI